MDSGRKVLSAEMGPIEFQIKNIMNSFWFCILAKAISAFQLKTFDSAQVVLFVVDSVVSGYIIII